MAIKSLKERPRGPTDIEIDITGPKGNAHYLLHLASFLSRSSLKSFLVYLLTLFVFHVRPCLHFCYPEIYSIFLV